ncbi:uroporphyrinogen-III C-methyltransferase [Limibacter armeniacum]|uniref:uroporphyrinogen-III C-methyltransferase n=1 Tax=Limibacter armeniacum TaxID=466084 RepID=UPI002FE6AC63
MSVQQIQPKLTLVGAGPGDKDLISIKGMKALQAADVILYDALVNPELLDHATNAKKVFVGKRAGHHYLPQEEINQLIIDFAFSHGHVVRLKGGDPLVFGRGQEEINAASAFGIQVEIIPGISSVTSAPASIGIPVTCRGVSESFWVITGTTQSNSLSKDLPLSAQSSATVLILMGLGKLSLITQLFSMYRSKDEPVAIVQNATWDNQQFVTGTLSDIEAKVREQQIGTPGIIIIGEVVKHRSPLEILKANQLSQPE